MAGHPGYRQGYSWGVQHDTGQQACAEGLGFTAEGARFWKHLGCGTSGSGSAHWGNNLAPVELRVRSIRVTAAVHVTWEA